LVQAIENIISAKEILKDFDLASKIGYLIGLSLIGSSQGVKALK
jgi:hypothetical protein